MIYQIIWNKIIIFPHFRSNDGSTGSHSVTSSSSKSGSVDSARTSFSHTSSTKFDGNQDNPEITSTIKRNPKAKLTTFCSPEAQIMESPQRKSPAILNGAF